MAEVLSDSLGLPENSETVLRATFHQKLSKVS